MSGGVHISLKAEKIFEIFGISVTNSIITTWIVMILLVLFSYFATRKMSKIPSKLQLIAEILVGGLFQLFESISGKHTKKIFPIVGTLFIFIIILNWFGLIPGVGTIGMKETIDHREVFKPLLRAGTADLNTTIAFALVAVVFIQYFGFSVIGKKYLSHFFNFKDPINFSVGILELVGEFTKIISFAFRLFGNIFAGEVLLTIIAFLIPLFAPLPFLLLELFVGFIQALVFSMLTTVFLTLTTTYGEH